MIVKNGKKRDGSQNYRRKNCGRQFVSDFQKICLGSLSTINQSSGYMLAIGNSVRKTRDAPVISINKVLKVISASKYRIETGKERHDRLEIDGFYTYVGNKKNKLWLLYAYHRETGKIVAYVWGNRDLKTAQKLRKRLKDLGVTYNKIVMDNWDSFVTAFATDKKLIGKKHTVGTGGITAAYGTLRTGLFGEPAAFPKNCLIINGSLIRSFSTSITASFEVNHTL
jgi:IS1 family transposase